MMNEPGNPLLRDSVSACKKAFAVVAVFSMCINLLMLTAPLYMLQVFDRVITSRNTDTLIMLTLIAGLALLAMAALEAVRTFALIRISSWLDNQLAGHVLSGAVVAALHSERAPSVQGLRDLATLRTFLSGQSIFPIMDAPWTPIFLAVMFMLHSYLGWLSVFGAIVLFALALANEVTTRNLLVQSGGASMAALSQAETAARNADVIEAMGMMPSMIKRWRGKNLESLDLQARASARSGSITASSKLFRMFLQIGILSIGAWLVIQGELTAGAMIAGSILMGRALAPVEQAIGTWKQMVGARNAYDRIKDQLDQSPSGPPGMPLPAPTGVVHADGAAFTYPGAREPILRNITFGLEPGEALGLIGPTAVGKTTLARMLVGNLSPVAGHMRLDGMDVSQWASDDLGKHIGYLPQGIELFSGTISENIARMQEVDSEMVIAAARQAGVHDMILGMEKGYDTEIGEGGKALSGGQRQRIGLARALYGDPRLLVFDEPNSNLDNDGEAALIGAIRSLKARGATAVVIAHRPSILRDVDKILVLKAGTVEMFGPRDDVQAKLENRKPEIPTQPVEDRSEGSPASPKSAPKPTQPSQPRPSVSGGSFTGLSSWNRPVRASFGKSLPNTTSNEDIGKPSTINPPSSSSSIGDQKLKTGSKFSSSTNVKKEKPAKTPVPAKTKSKAKATAAKNPVEIVKRKQTAKPKQRTSSPTKKTAPRKKNKARAK
jgi:ATP-binding cassette subfamily B protein/ATP-binding cassette subfamily C protein